MCTILLYRYIALYSFSMCISARTRGHEIQNIFFFSVQLPYGLFDQMKIFILVHFVSEAMYNVYDCGDQLILSVLQRNY